MIGLTLLQEHVYRQDLAELLNRPAAVMMAGYLSLSQIISLVHCIVIAQADETSDD